MASFKCFYALLLVSYATAAAPPPVPDPALKAAILNKNIDPNDVISISEPSGHPPEKLGVAHSKREDFGSTLRPSGFRKAEKRNPDQQETEINGVPIGNFDAPTLWKYTHQVGGWGGKDVVNINHHDCNNSMITSYIYADGTNRRVDSLGWDLVQDDLQAEANRAAAANEEPKFRQPVQQVLVEFSTVFAGAVKKVFDPSLYVEPANYNYDVIKGYPVHGMSLLLFAHGQNKTFSFAFQQTVLPPYGPDDKPAKFPTAVAALAFIGGLLTDLLVVAGNTDGHWAHLSNRDVSTIWAAMSAMKYLFKATMNTLPRPCKSYTDCDPSPVTALPADSDMQLALGKLKAGKFLVYGTPWESFENLTYNMSDASFDPFEPGQCDDPGNGS